MVSHAGRARAVPSHQDEHFKGHAAVQQQRGRLRPRHPGARQDRRRTDEIEFLIVEGDIVADDLGLYPRLEEIGEHVEWLRNDLSHVPRHKLVVLNMHIPLTRSIDNTSP